MPGCRYKTQHPPILIIQTLDFIFLSIHVEHHTGNNASIFWCFPLPIALTMFTVISCSLQIEMWEKQVIFLVDGTMFLYAIDQHYFLGVMCSFSSNHEAISMWSWKGLLFLNRGVVVLVWPTKGSHSCIPKMKQMWLPHNSATMVACNKKSNGNHQLTSVAS